MVMTGPNAQAKIDIKFAKADSLSKAAGLNKNAFANDLKKSFSKTDNTSFPQFRK